MPRYSFTPRHHRTYHASELLQLFAFFDALAMHLEQDVAALFHGLPPLTEFDLRP